MIHTVGVILPTATATGTLAFLLSRTARVDLYDLAIFALFLCGLAAGSALLLPPMRDEYRCVWAKNTDYWAPTPAWVYFCEDGHGNVDLPAPPKGSHP